MKKQYDYLIVGAGLFGSVFAHKMTQKGKKCLIIEKRNHAGGNVYCREKDGINVHQYGAHIFHTDYKDVWDFVNGFVEFNRFTNAPLASYQGKLYNLPFNMNTFNKLWGVNTPTEAKQKIEEQRSAYWHIEQPANLEEQALKLCGDDIYHIFIKGYTEKQWGRPASELPAFIIQRLPFRFTFDNNYFNDTYQGIPKGGYNQLVNALTEGIEVRQGVDYFENRTYFDGLADKVLFTGCIDAYFNYELGALEYRSLTFEHECLDMEDFQGNAVVNYNDGHIPFTRIIEHKHFEFGKQPHTIITREYPKAFAKNDEPYYPVNNAQNTEKYRLYKEKALQIPRLLLGGRLAHYAYYDMDDTIKAAFQLAQEELMTV